MELFITDRVGLIIAFLNVSTLLLLLHLFLHAVGASRSRVLGVLDRLFTPIFQPVRKILPAWRVDAAPLVVAALLQVAVFFLKRGR